MSLLSGNGHLGAVDNTPNTTRHITFMLMANLLVYLHIQQSLFELCFWSLPTPDGNIWLFICSTLQYVHQPVSNFVRLVFEAENVV